MGSQDGEGLLKQGWIADGYSLFGSVRVQPLQCFDQIFQPLPTACRGSDNRDSKQPGKTVQVDSYLLSGSLIHQVDT